MAFFLLLQQKGNPPKKFLNIDYSLKQPQSERNLIRQLPQEHRECYWLSEKNPPRCSRGPAFWRQRLPSLKTTAWRTRFHSSTLCQLNQTILNMRLMRVGSPKDWMVTSKAEATDFVKNCLGKFEYSLIFLNLIQKLKQFFWKHNIMEALPTLIFINLSRSPKSASHPLSCHV